MRCKRSNWKIPFVDIANKLNFFKFVHLCVRRFANVPFGLVGKKVKIHNGKKIFTFNITSKHVGLKFGEMMNSKMIPKPKLVKKRNLKNFKKGK